MTMIEYFNKLFKQNNWDSVDSKQWHKIHKGTYQIYDALIVLVDDLFVFDLMIKNQNHIITKELEKFVPLADPTSLDEIEKYAKMSIVDWQDAGMKAYWEYHGPR